VPYRCRISGKGHRFCSVKVVCKRRDERSSAKFISIKPSDFGARETCQDALPWKPLNWFFLPTKRFLHKSAPKHPNPYLFNNTPQRAKLDSNMLRHIRHYDISCLSPTATFCQYSHEVSVSRHRLSTYGRRAFAVAGPTVWNSLPDDMRDPDVSEDSYRQSLKTFLFSQY